MTIDHHWIVTLRPDQLMSTAELTDDQITSFMANGYFTSSAI